MILILLFSRTTSYRLHWVLNTLEDLVAEDAQLQDLGQQLVGFFFAVALLGTDQCQQTMPDRAGHLPGNFHARLAYALQ